MKLIRLLIIFALAPAALAAQQDPVARLREVLPADVADKVIPIVTEALSHGLPHGPIVSRALEGSAKGRSGDEIVAAARAMANDLAAAHSALERGGRAPLADETEAAATTMRMGVDGRAVSELASSAPSGRSLAVPLAVLGALVANGLPVGEALAALQDRLAGRATNAEIAALPAEAGRLMAEGYRPSEVGRALAAARSSRTIPGGPPITVPGNAGRPGRRPPPHPVAPVAGSRS